MDERPLPRRLEEELLRLKLMLAVLTALQIGTLSGLILLYFWVSDGQLPTWKGAPPVALQLPTVAAPSSSPGPPPRLSEVVGAPQPLMIPEPSPDEPEPEEPRPRSAPASPSSGLKGAWAQVSAGDLAGAGATFRDVLSERPGDAEANYGTGYVLVKQGNTALAAPYLCAAHSNARGSDVELLREVTQLLRQHGLTCH